MQQSTRTTRSNPTPTPIPLASTQLIATAHINIDTPDDDCTDNIVDNDNDNALTRKRATMTMIDKDGIYDLILKRKAARLINQYDVSDAITTHLTEYGVELKSNKIDATEWFYANGDDNNDIDVDADVGKQVNGSNETDTTVNMKNRATITTRTRTSRSFRTKANRKGNDRTKNKKVRFQQFADFCVELFGTNLLRQGSGVIDVAGGKARMALELSLERQIPCTAVDPRFSKLSDFTAGRITKLIALASDEKQKEFKKGNLNHITTAAPTAVAEQTQTRMERRSYYLSPSEFFRKPDQEDPDERQKIDLYMEHIGFQFHKCLFNEEYCKNNSTWSNASVVIGMHPDEATEAIVDEALKSNKPFAVVPCCVFPSLFKERRLRSNGRHVRSLGEFIQYLTEKHTDIKLKVLEDVPGSNTVVYML